MSRYRSSSAYNQLLVAYIMSKIKFDKSNVSSMLNYILMSKIIFMKYLPPVMPKLVPKLKMFKIYLYLPPVRPKLITKLKMLSIY